MTAVGSSGSVEAQGVAELATGTAAAIVAGHCMLLRMQMLEEVGVLCETDTTGIQFPEFAQLGGQAHYGSDRMLCWRANRAGWKVLDCHCQLCDHALRARGGRRRIGRLFGPCRFGRCRERSLRRHIGAHRRLLQCPFLARHDLLQGRSQVPQQVPAIGHLLRVRGSLPCPFRVGGRPIPRDDLHAGVGLQPSRQGLGLAIRQQIDDLAAFQVDEDRPILLPPTQRPIVHAENAGRGRLGRGQTGQVPE